METKTESFGEYDFETGLVGFNDAHAGSKNLIHLKKPISNRGFRKSKVLVLDKDTKGFCVKSEVEYTKFLVTQFGATVDTAITLQEFIKKLGSETYDFILIDFGKYENSLGQQAQPIIEQIIKRSKTKTKAKLINYTYKSYSLNSKMFNCYCSKSWGLSQLYAALHEIWSADFALIPDRQDVNSQKNKPKREKGMEAA